MKYRFLALFTTTFLCLIIYNSMSDGVRTVSSMGNNRQWSAPAKATLAPGDYVAKSVYGRLSGDGFHNSGQEGQLDEYVPLLNRGVVYPAMGFNDGNTDPTRNNPDNAWQHMVDEWVDTSQEVGSRVIPTDDTFVANPEQPMSLYQPTPYTKNNLGGDPPPVKLLQTPDAPILDLIPADEYSPTPTPTPTPEPTTLLLLGLGLIGLAKIRKGFEE
ncbi:MAG: PEP-CTERM sorting domain-containing protein [Proteobacteria bacterium]|nr:PEP-CTERM sorting domain-containing protein [Pseudomonadota bacterium]MBU4037276.1 PEP-CTERM sorting domain-containing protein [Pseudomonadota bacterium]